MIQFWAKMQLQEIRGVHDVLPPAAGTLFIQEAFSQLWTPIVYIIGFIALWFHMTHGFWSMFQSCGWNGKIWMSRLKTIGNIWVTLVVLLFAAEAIVFTVQANKGVYTSCPVLQEQYMEMQAAHDNAVVAPVCAGENCPQAECSQAACGKADCAMTECKGGPCSCPEGTVCSPEACQAAGCAGCAAASSETAETVTVETVTTNE